MNAVNLFHFYIHTYTFTHKLIYGKRKTKNLMFQPMKYFLTGDDSKGIQNSDKIVPAVDYFKVSINTQGLSKI